MHGRDRANKLAETRLEEINRIKAKLFAKGLSLLDIDRAYKLPRGTAGNTLQQANEAGERAIAAALGTKPHLLWRRRYFASGLRKSPQPPENYERPPTMRQRRNEARA